MFRQADKRRSRWKHRPSALARQIGSESTYDSEDSFVLRTGKIELGASKEVPIGFENYKLHSTQKIESRTTDPNLAVSFK